MESNHEDILNFKNDPKITKLLEKEERILFSALVYKFNKRCKRQERALMVTDRAIYNINNIDLFVNFLSVFSSSAIIKRRIGIKKLTAVSISNASSEFVLHVKEEYDYRFSSQDKRDRILSAILRSWYSNIKETPLPFFFIDEALLMSITTTEDDKKAGISRMPKTEGLGMDEEKLREKFKEMIKAKEKQKAETETVFTRGKNGKVSLDDFEILKVLGRGAFGKVMLVEKKDNKQVYAIKAMHKDEIIDKDQVEHTKTEKYVLQQSSSPFVVSLEFAFQTPEKLFFVMKFMRGGELFQHLRHSKRFDEKRAKFYAAQILLALEHLHSMDVVYRDLKPENILMDENGHVCLADFGMSKILKKGQKTKSFVGTPEYLAPEMIDNRGHDYLSDWWALGILIFEMLNGYPPFYLKGQTTQKMFAAIKEKPVDFNPKVKMSEECKSIIKELLDKNMDSRLGVKGANQIKEHKWFEDINWNDMMERKINPPFKPKLNGETDVGNFDTEFTREDPSHSMAPPTNMKLIKKHENAFSDFSYVPEKNMNQNY